MTQQNPLTLLDEATRDILEVRDAIARGGSTDEAITLIDQAQANLDDAVGSINTAQVHLHDAKALLRPTNVIDVTPGQSVQAAIDSAPVGATLRLAAGTYDGALVIRKSVTLTGPNPPPPGTATESCPVWLTAYAEQSVLVTPEASDVAFVGIGFKQQYPDYELALLQGNHLLLDRCVGLGDPANGLRRGWRVEGKNITVSGCYMNNIWRPGRDTVCIGSWQVLDGLLVEHCYLCGGAETVMFGGADSPSADRICKNIKITNCTLTKDPAWYGMGAQIKTPFELKSAKHVYMADCVLEWGGIAEGQGAYLMVITVRNQDGTAPWECIEDVVIERCACRHGGGGMNILGHDDLQPSGGLVGLTVRNCSFVDLNPDGPWANHTEGWYGHGRGVMFNGKPQQVTLEALTMEGVSMNSLGSFANTPNQPVGLTMRNWKYFTSDYGWKIDDGGMDVPPACDNLKQLMPDLVYEITGSDPGAAGYPQG